jgi:trigger factor
MTKEEETMDFKISVEEQGEVYRNISIEVPRAEYSRRFDDAVSRASGRVRLKGFRPGRVPKEMVAKLYGSELHHEVMESFAVKGLKTAFDEHKLEVVGRPEVTFGENDGTEDLKITAAVAIAPKPQVNNYNDLSFEAEVRNVTDADVENELEHIRKHHGEFVAVEGRNTVEQGDYAALEYELLVDGNPLPDAKKETRFVEAGAERLPKELDQALIGAPIGEDREAAVSFNDDEADTQLAGKSGVYRFKVSEIKQRLLPELNDELAKKTGMAEDLSGLRDAVRKDLEKSAEDQNTAARERKLFETLIERNSFEVPQIMIDEEIRALLFEMGIMDRRNQKSYQMDISPFRKHLEDQALFRVRSLILLDRIREQEKVKPTDEEFENWLEGLVTKGGFKSREELNTHFGLPKNRDRLLEICAREKTTEKLLQSATITEVPFDEEKAQAAIEE